MGKKYAGSLFANKEPKSKLLSDAPACDYDQPFSPVKSCIYRFQVGV